MPRSFRSVSLVHEEIRSAQGLLDRHRNLPVKEAFELAYDLPPGLPPTQLSADRPVFWELEANLEVPGLDFRQTYLVPICNSTLETAVNAKTPRGKDTKDKEMERSSRT